MMYNASCFICEVQKNLQDLSDEGLDNILDLVNSEKLRRRDRDGTLLSKM